MKRNTVIGAYEKLNARNFGGVLNMPRIAMTRCRTVHAQYTGDAIEFNLADTSGIFALYELVFHEMCHQYIAEFLGVENWDNHNSTFVKTYRKFCAGIMTDKEFCK